MHPPTRQRYNASNPAQRASMPSELTARKLTIADLRPRARTPDLHDRDNTATTHRSEMPLYVPREKGPARTPSAKPAAPPPPPPLPTARTATPPKPPKAPKPPKGPAHMPKQPYAPKLERKLAKVGCSISDVNALSQQLIERYPACFDTSVRRPLKVGIHADIISDLACNPLVLSAALRGWCSHHLYLLRMATKSSHRHALSGERASELTGAEKENARQQYEALLKRHRERRARRSAP
jgi:hypothetical protein